MTITTSQGVVSCQHLSASESNSRRVDKYSRRRFFQYTASALFAGTVPVLWNRTYAANQCNVEVWEISTRHLPFGCRVPDRKPSLEVYRCQGEGTPWEKDILENAVALSNEFQTIVYAHGNWMTRENARGRANFIADQIARRAEKPIRLIMLSWPSQRERRPIRDTVENAECADTQAFYFDWLLRQFPEDAQSSVLGFSFGARVVCGALHLLAGGTLQGASSIDRDPSRSRENVYRVSFAAPAVDRSWLANNGRNRLAMNVVDRMINLYNSKDPVLRRFRFLDLGPSRPIAAGFSGFANAGNPRINQPLASQDRIIQYDCGSSIGSTHSEKSYYLECNRFVAAIDNLLWRG